MLIVGRHIQLATDDGLPQNICLNCVCLVDQAFGFRRKCIEVDNVLRNLKYNTKVLKVNQSDSDVNIVNVTYLNTPISIEDSEELESTTESTKSRDISLRDCNLGEKVNRRPKNTSSDISEDFEFETLEEVVDDEEDFEIEKLEHDISEDFQDSEKTSDGEEVQEPLRIEESDSDLVEEETVTLDPSHQQIQIMIQGYPPDINGLQQQIKAQMLPAGTVVAPIPMTPKQPDITINYDFIKKENMGLAYTSPNSLLSYTNQATNNPDVSIYILIFSKITRLLSQIL